jgi:hypothetical protein
MGPKGEPYIMTNWLTECRPQDKLNSTQLVVFSLERQADTVTRYELLRYL